MQNVDFENDLNEEQRRAVQAPDGPVLVIAAAGTGKTRTLTYRVAHLVEKGVNPNRVLLLTFTNRAAAEMLERAQSLVGESVGGLWGGTFHHMANRLLRRHADVLGYNLNYTILDQDDSRTLVRNCADEMDLLGKHFPKPDVLLSVYGYAVSTEQAIEDIAEERFEHHQVDVADVVRVHKAYEDRKRELHAMDFDDLLVNAVRLFREDQYLRERYQEQFLYMLVDEYQDTNTVQSAWIDLLASQHRNVLVVGDDFQSIYSWRGANYRNILSFPERYPDASVFKLETNYRSVPEILEVANACIAGNPDQYQKTLRAVREAYQKPRAITVGDGYEQATFIIDRLAHLKREGYALNDMAILYRSHYQAMELQLEMTRNQIPYVITSGVRFFEQAHIKDVCSFVRMWMYPADELSFLRLLELLPKVGKKTSAKIWKKLGRRFDLTEAASVAACRALLPAAAKVRWSELEDVIELLQGKERGEEPADVVGKFVDLFYDEYAVETFDNYNRRVEDVQEFVRYVGEYKNAAAFLDEMALLTNLDAEADAVREETQDAVRLSTVHQAKGLEWKVIFILWLADGMFPSHRSINDGGEEEERRLFYVAATRAKDELYLCTPQTRRTRDGGVTYYSRSRFLEELPETLLESGGGTSF